MLLKYLSMIIGDAPEYDNYARQLPELSYACTNSFDFRKIFDKTAETIFIDTGHVSVQGEKILAQHMFNAILPHVDPSLNPSQYEEIFSNPYKKFQIESEYDFRGRVINNESFSETDLHNGVYWFGEISFVDYINNNMNNADFTYSFLSDVIFSENDAIENKFGRSTIIKTSFLNNNFEASDFSGARILESVFRNDSMNKNLFEGSTIKNTIFENVDLSDSVFNITYFENVKFKTITTANLELSLIHI